MKSGWKHKRKWNEVETLDWIILDHIADGLFEHKELRSTEELIFDYPITMSMKQIDEIAEKPFEVVPNTNSEDYEVENTTVSESKRSKTVWNYTYMKFYRAWIRSPE